jgi:hypothetical protein
MNWLRGDRFVYVLNAVPSNVESRQGLTTLPIRSIALGAIGAISLLAVTLFVLVTLSSLPRTTPPSPLVAPAIVASPEEPVNAPEHAK